MHIITDALERPTPPRFSIHWDPVNREAYFDDMTPKAEPSGEIVDSAGCYALLRSRNMWFGVGLSIHVFIMPFCCFFVLFFISSLLRPLEQVDVDEKLLESTLFL